MHRNLEYQGLSTMILSLERSGADAMIVLLAGLGRWVLFAFVADSVRFEIPNGRQDPLHAYC